MIRCHAIAVFLGLAIGWPAQPAEIAYRQQAYPLYPAVLEHVPDLPSPLTLPDGTEVVLGMTADGRAALIRVTVENGAEYVYARAGKGRQLEVDAADFPTLARTGLHSEIELDQVWTITGRSVAEITEIGRPGMSSGAGFMADDEDIVSVLKGDNRIVRALGLTHPELARPLFHVWSSILEQLAAIHGHGRPWGEIPSIRYHGREVRIEWSTTKGWQDSIFDDEIIGGLHINISRPPDDEETAFLKARYPDLPPGEMDGLVERLSRFHISEMVPYYVMRYGFYEGHTDYRADPVTVAFVFGLRSLEEIEAAFGEDLVATLTRHFTSADLLADELIEMLLVERNRKWNVTAKELGTLGDAAVEPLAEILRDGTRSAWSRRKAAWTLGLTQSEAAVAPLIEAFDDEDGAVRRAAGSALADLGERAIGALERTLGEPRVHVRLAAMHALGRMDSERVIEPLAAALEDREWSVRRAAGLALGDRGHAAATGVLRRLLTDPEDYTRNQAALYLGRIGAEAAAGDLARALDHPHWQTRQRAADALVQIGEAAVEPLLRTAGGGSTRARARACEALGKIAAEQAVDVLAAALADGDWTVRVEAAVALTRIPSEVAVDRLIAALAAPEAEVRKAAAWVLGELKAARAIGALLSSLADREAGWMAAVALGKIGSDEAVTALGRQLLDGGVQQRRAAAWALAHIDSPRAREALDGVTDDQDREVRLWSEPTSGRAEVRP